MKFAELSNQAKQRALEYHAQGFDYEWWDAVYEDAKRIANIIGVDIGDIHFSGFWSQGDGASFSGHYRYAKGATKAIREYAPQDKEMHRITDALQKAQSRNFYRLIADITESSRGFFLHISVYDDANQYRDIGAYGDDIAQALRDFAYWIYRSLEKEYEYLNSAEALEELDNEYDEEGNLV